MATSSYQRNGIGLPASGAERADREVFVAKVSAALRRLVRLKYFSWEIEGIEHVPRTGPVVFAQNHAGWFALDTIFVGCSIAEAIGTARAPYFAAEDAALAAPVVGPFLRRLGGLPASAFRHPERLPPEFESFGICPEGVEGNCKPFWEAYRMHEWNRGFVKLAVARRAPIVPVAVFGGEESLPVAWTIKALEPLIGSILGLPLVPVPLPARWKIVFHAAVDASERDGSMGAKQHAAAVTRRLQRTVQGTLDREARGHALARLSSFVATKSSTATQRVPEWLLNQDSLLDDAASSGLGRMTTR
jgi:1-acyl-sn-glycerol-3-phosphate acyltransferase